MNDQIEAKISGAGPYTDFEDSVRKLADCTHATRINAAGTPISALASHLDDVFERVENGSLEVITRGRERFLLLSEEQIMALVMLDK